MRVLLVDDHPLFRQGLKFLLADLDPATEFLEACDSSSALAHAGGAQVDMVLLDLNLPGSNGMDVLKAARTAFECASVVVLSGDDEPHVIRQAIARGAAGYVPKSSTPPVLLAALRLVMAGGTYLPPHVLQDTPWPQCPPDTLAGTLPTAPSGLSARQLEVLLNVIQGKANKVIAREMHLSEGTVKAHLSAAFRALGVQNRTEAVYAAARLGLTERTGQPH